MIYTRILLPLTFAIGMSTVGLIYVLTGRWWPPYLATMLARLTKRESTVRAYVVIASGIATGVGCLLLASVRH